MSSKENLESDEEIFEDAAESIHGIELAHNGKERASTLVSPVSARSEPISSRPLQSRKNKKSNDNVAVSEGEEEQEDQFLEASNEDIQASLEQLGLEDSEDTTYPDAKTIEQGLDAEFIGIKTVVDLFLSSHYKEAEEMVKPKYKKSLIATQGYAVIITIKAFMTFEPNDIRNALVLQHGAVEMANYYRKRDHGILKNISGIVKGYSLDGMTRLQRHAELIFAECYLLKGVLTVFNDESFISFMRESINIRNSYLILKQCYKWLNKTYAAASKTDKSTITDPKQAFLVRNANEPLPSHVDADFVSGVCLCMGVFNLLLSLLPDKFLKIFEAIGFSASRSLALRLFRHPHAKNGLRHFICEFVLAGYHCILPNFIASIEKDREFAQALVQRMLHQYPTGAFSLFFVARNYHSEGDVADAIAWYKKSIASQDDWTQLHHICYWESAHCHILQFQYVEAAKLVATLSQESRWSKAIYHYLYAIYIYMALEIGEIEEKDEFTYKHVREIMVSIPNRLQRIAGKRIPLEKFVARKSRKFIMQSRLFLPAFEVMMIWNLYSIMKTGPLNRVFDLLQREIAQMESIPEEKRHENHFDDLFLAHLLKAIILREKKELVEAIDQFYHVLTLEKKLVLDHYLAPYARYELARVYLKANPPMLKEAKLELDIIKRDYKKYSLENQVHFRVHNTQRKIRELEFGTSQEDLTQIGPS